MDRQTYLETVADVAGQLNETNDIAIKQIKRMIRHCGIDFTRDILRQALETEAQGGMMTRDGSRRRTPGGTFFALAKSQMNERQRGLVFFPRQYWRAQRAKQAAPSMETTQPGAVGAEAPSGARPAAAEPPELPPDAPAAVATRYAQLTSAAATFRKRIADLESRPAGQRAGLEMVQKMLANAEQQLAELLAQAGGKSS